MRVLGLFLALFMALFFSHLAHAATEVTASVSHNPVAEGQPFTLNIEANSNLPANAFDPQLLLRQGFVVGNTSTGRRQTTINGVSTTSTTWTTTLMARTAGDYTIPAFEVGDGRTKAIQLRVKQGDVQQQQEIRLESSLDRRTVYIGQPAVYSTKVWVASNLEQANIIPPSMLGASFETLGEDQQEMEIVDGKRYRTLTRRWLLTAEQAGSFNISGTRLSGITSDRYGRSLPVDVVADTLAIEVKPIPDGAMLNWLPSTDVFLNDELQPEQSRYQQGEAFTRRITLNIAGITEEQLPDISLDYGDDFRVYPEPYQDKTVVQDGIVFAQRVLSAAIIPSRSGELTLPGWQLDWWNVEQDEAMLAELPSKQIEVDASRVNTLALPEPAISPSGNTPAAQRQHSWLTWLFGLAWLTTAFLWLWHSRRTPKQVVESEDETSPTLNHSPAWQAFEKACQRDNAHQAEYQLRRYLQAEPNQELEKVLEELSQQLWSPLKDDVSDKPDLLALLQRCQQVRTQAASSKTQVLPPLNPPH